MACRDFDNFSGITSSSSSSSRRLLIFFCTYAFLASLYGDIWYRFSNTLVFDSFK
jgi:hypothetical protein